jgi:hypothetical protein
MMARVPSRVAYVMERYPAQRDLHSERDTCAWRIPILPVLARDVHSCKRSDSRSCSQTSWGIFALIAHLVST